MVLHLYAPSRQFNRPLLIQEHSPGAEYQHAGGIKEEAAKKLPSQHIYTFATRILGDIDWETSPVAIRAKTALTDLIDKESALGHVDGDAMKKDPRLFRLWQDYSQISGSIWVGTEQNATSTIHVYIVGSHDGHPQMEDKRIVLVKQDEVLWSDQSYQRNDIEFDLLGTARGPIGAFRNNTLRLG